MANRGLCPFNKFGYCRYLDTCRKKHTKDICEIPQCEVNKCSKRHPRTCKYYQEYGRCKFGEDCSYKHNKNETNSEIVKELENLKKKAEAEIESLKVKVAACERKLDEVNSILTGKKVLDENDKIEDIQKELNVNINCIKTVAAEHDRKLSDYIVESFVRMNGLENKLGEVIDFVNMNIVSNTSKVNSQPKSTKSGAAQQNTEIHQKSKSLLCEHCEQVFKTQKELLSHKRLCHYRDFT